MKFPVITILFSTLMLAGSGLNAQNKEVKMPIDPDTKLITYKEVVDTPGTPAELYIRAIAWINKQYKNPADATKVRDPQSGLIEIVHRFEITKNEKGTILMAGVVDYTMKLELKEGRYRYTITNFNSKEISRRPIEVWMNKNDQFYKPIWDNYLQQVDEYTRKLIESLKQDMLPPAAKKPDTW